MPGKKKDSIFVQEEAVDRHKVAHDKVTLAVTEKSPKPSKAKQQRKWSDEAREKMLERLRLGRQKGFETRMKNKEIREQHKVEHKERLEKGLGLLQHEELFEKKYADKFEELNHKMGHITTHLEEMRDRKIRKATAKEEERLKQADEAEKREKELKDKASKQETHVSLREAASHMPNYRMMKFGKNL